MARIQLFQNMSDESANNKSIDYFFVFSEINDDLMFIPGVVLEPDYTKRELTKAEITATIKTGQTAKQFQYIQKLCRLNKNIQSYEKE